MFSSGADYNQQLRFIAILDIDNVFRQLNALVIKTLQYSKTV
jgi:hypothetical protein